MTRPAIGWTLSAFGLLLNIWLIAAAVNRFVWGRWVVPLSALLGALGLGGLGVYLVVLRVHRMRKDAGLLAGHWRLAVAGMVLPLVGWLGLNAASHSVHPARTYVMIQHGVLSGLVEAQARYRLERGVFAVDMDSLVSHGWPGPSESVTMEITQADSNGFVAETAHEYATETCSLNAQWDPEGLQVSGRPSCKDRPGS